MRNRGSSSQQSSGLPQMRILRPTNNSQPASQAAFPGIIDKILRLGDGGETNKL